MPTGHWKVFLKYAELRYTKMSVIQGDQFSNIFLTQFNCGPTLLSKCLQPLQFADMVQILIHIDPSPQLVAFGLSRQTYSTYCIFDPGMEFLF